MGSRNSDILVVGAGMAGLSCATRLAEAGHSVIVLDKGRGPGGRLAARRAEIAGETVSFDHGAQYFTARDLAFRTQVARWQETGVVAPWVAAGEDAFVGVPGMNAPIKAMAEALDVRWNTRAESLVHDGTNWCAKAVETLFCGGALVVAVPAEQAAELLKEAMPEYAAIAGAVTSEPCWAVMVAFADKLAIEKDTLRAPDLAISWAARNSAKPGRAGEECWVLHASPTRSRELLDQTNADVAQALLADFFAQTGAVPVEPVHLAAHRWLYAMPGKGEGEPAHYDPVHRIGIAGDYLHSPRVEGAFVSGTALAQKVLGAG